MAHRRCTISELLKQLAPQQALCAFNVENFDTLLPALKAAAEVDAPVVIAFSVPAARYLGFEFAAELAELTARRFGTTYALHLDHCEDPDDLRDAARTGFTSANFLSENTADSDRYLRKAVALRNEYESEALSLEFILGTLGHQHDEIGPPAPTVPEITAFAEACRPDILGFHCGSLHGMPHRSRDIDAAMIAAAAAATQLPLVLHGSSGVREQQVLMGIDAGIRKINIETAIRAVFTDTLTAFIGSGGSAVRKPRYLTMAIDEALTSTFREYLELYTLRTAHLSPLPLGIIPGGPLPSWSESHSTHR